MAGKHLIKSWSSTQPVITLSSGEAELHGVVKGGAGGMGMLSLLKDLGVELHLNVWTDSIASKGICARQGLGKVRHLDTSLLWIQQKIKDKDLEVDKIHGPKNPADCLTKHVDRATLVKHLETMGLEFEQGRAESARQLAADATA